MSDYTDTQVAAHTEIVNAMGSRTLIPRTPRLLHTRYAKGVVPINADGFLKPRGWMRPVAAYNRIDLHLCDLRDF